jgi:citrate synthase
MLSATDADRITVRGSDLAELIGTVPFPSVVHLLYTGELPDPAAARLIDAVMVASIDHGAGPPSVLAARTAISGGATLPAAAAAGLLTFGDYHGAAVESAMEAIRDVLERVGEGSNADALTKAASELGTPDTRLRSSPAQASRPSARSAPRGRRRGWRRRQPHRRRRGNRSELDRGIGTSGADEHRRGDGGDPR